MNGKVVICLFDVTGLAGAPWLRAGYSVMSFDKQHSSLLRPGNWHRIPWDADADGGHAVLEYVQRSGLQPAFLWAFPPCNDLAISGALHFKSKLNAVKRRLF